MTWNKFAEYIEKFLLLCAMLSACAGLVELVFKPFRKYKAKKASLAEIERIRLAREERIDDSLDKIDQHLDEAAELSKWQDSVDNRLDKHEEAIKESKNERRVVWRAQRATLGGLMQLLQRNNERNESIEKIIEEMDVYVDDNLRQ